MGREKAGKLNSFRKRTTNTHGMTMGELLTVVAIIGIIAAVAFIAFAHHQRSIAQIERDAIAKEIFVAAQNHLTMARGEGYLDTKTYGKLGDYSDDSTNDSTQGIYYYVVNGGSAAPTDADNDATDMFNQMLPFGSIDEMVRGQGSYVIRYQPKIGAVLDVFYCTPTGTKYGHDFSVSNSSPSEYSGLMSNYTGEGNTNRRHYEPSEDSDVDAVIGWYGGALAADLQERQLKAPTIKVVNKETLYVEITDNNGDLDDNGKSLKSSESGANSRNIPGKVYGIRLIITGVTSKVQHYLDVGTDDVTAMGSNTYKLVLDDITKKSTDNRFAKKRFYELDYDDSATLTEPNKNYFIPGENIRIQAVAYSVDYLTNIARSKEKITNSLFEGIADKKLASGADGQDGIPETAYVGNVRHLENLDKMVSDVMHVQKREHAADEPLTEKTSRVAISTAVQTNNLDWYQFLSKVGGNTTEIKYGDNDFTNEGCYKPIEIDPQTYTGGISYDGNNHSITGVKVVIDTATKPNASANAGLFDSITYNCSVSNLELIEFSVNNNQTDSKVGALAGSLTGTTVTNVVAHEMTPGDRANYYSTYNIPATEKRTISGVNAGGLVGAMSGGKVQYSAASMAVNGTTTAGGLVGSAAGSADVTGCYSGGHTDDGSYEEWIKDHDYDVIGPTAGGLIGDANSATIRNSYSTCSVSWPSTLTNGSLGVGGFVGTAKGTITNCYCTGLVNGALVIEGKGENEHRTFDNAFIGSYERGNKPAVSSCSYYSIVNEQEMSSGGKGKITGIEYKLSGLTEKKNGVYVDESGIAPFDDNTAGFKGFVSGKSNAEPYDPALENYYENDYYLKSVEKLLKDKKSGDDSVDISGDAYKNYFVHTHYGDWPAPEVFIINTTNQ